MKADLSLVVQPIVDHFLPLGPFLLWVHELRPSWSLVLLQFHSYALMALHLALQKGLLVGNELFLRPTLLSLLGVCGGLELAFLII